MARKKYRLFMLAKVGVVAFCYILFYEHPFISKDHGYDKLKHTTYIMLMLWFMALFFAFLFRFFQKIQCMEGLFSVER